MKTLATSLLAMVLVALATHGLHAADSAPAPRWFEHHLEYLTADGGRWIADNHPYRSESEPYDAYGMEWKWGLGKKTVTGRLYALDGDREIGAFWEFRVVWHPGEGRAIVRQYGSDGTIGEGSLSSVDETTVRTEQTFHSPDGSRYRAAHVNTESSSSKMTSQSYDVSDDGKENPRRKYVWHRAGKN